MSAAAAQLVAFNARVAAARAGDPGREFAAVASVLSDIANEIDPSSQTALATTERAPLASANSTARAGQERAFMDEWSRWSSVEEEPPKPMNVRLLRPLRATSHRLPNGARKVVLRFPSRRRTK